ncbi:unnamed protein product, partial [marine sediment metagenome]
MAADPIALVTGDWHIRKRDRTWVNRPGLVGDGAYGLDQLVQYVLDHEIPNVLLLGDILDERVQQSDATRLLRHTIDLLKNA